MSTRIRKLLREWGARLKAEANDLKRTPESISAELGVRLDSVHRIFAGEESPRIATQFIRAFHRHYPVSLRDISVEEDDLNDGVLVHTAAESKASSRVFMRVGLSDIQSPYYEYRDTATSRSAPFRPEWIQPLRVMENASPYDPMVVMNKGHLLHQFTFFIGDVNFYWQIGDARYSRELRTGDSCYITPFVPHSFTSRTKGQPGLIIAVTYGGALKRARHELADSSQDALRRFAGSAETELDDFFSRLTRCMAAESMTPDVLLSRLASHDSLNVRPPAYWSDVVHGNTLPTLDHVKALATCLHTSVSSLIGEGFPLAESVIVQRGGLDRAFELSSDYGAAERLVELVRSARQPNLKSFCWHSGHSAGQPVMYEHGLHEYIYNYSTTHVTLAWWNSSERRLTVDLAPGSSAYVRPFVRHDFVAEATKDSAEAGACLLIVRVPGAISEEVFLEYALAGPARARALHETDQWF